MLPVFHLTRRPRGDYWDIYTVFECALFVIRGGAVGPSDSTPLRTIIGKHTQTPVSRSITGVRNRLENERVCVCRYFFHFENVSRPRPITITRTRRACRNGRRFRFGFNQKPSLSTDRASPSRPADKKSPFIFFPRRTRLPILSRPLPNAARSRTSPKYKFSYYSGTCKHVIFFRVFFTAKPASPTPVAAASLL